MYYHLSFIIASIAGFALHKNNQKIMNHKLKQILSKQN